jgi:diguanylate cyclase (GGDEF)-like protein
MNSHFMLKIFLTIQFVVGMCLSLPVAAEEQSITDDLFAKISQSLKTEPEKTVLYLAQMQKLEPTLNQKQKEKYYVFLAASLSIRGRYKEEVELMRSLIEQVKNPESLAWFYYYLSDAHANLGQYEHAVIAMNEGMLLLPNIVELNTKIVTLQAAVTLLNSLRAYDESMLYASRIYALDVPVGNTYPKCIGMADKIEINFLLDESKLARSLIPQAIQFCDAYGSKFITLIVKTLSAIDLINSRNDERDLNTALSLLGEFSNKNQTSNFVAKLEEAIARSYLKKNNLVQAERYGLQAYQHAKTSSIFQIVEKSSETMAAIKRAQGQLDSAIEYYDINLALKRKVFDDQLQKNLAYQRVKFDARDKANQLALAEQKNKTLTIEKALQQGKNQNLLLLMTLGLILLSILGAWLIRTLQQKNIFRTSAQIDGLTRVSNRAHFMDCSTQAFKNTGSQLSVVLFDMDHFKKINDTFGHAAGDWVLKTVCDRVKMHLRKTDIYGRLGGEEFAICLSGINQDEVLALAERCRVAISEIDSNPCGFSFLITASFGLATRGIRELGNFEETLAGADKALYFSKNEGRNRVSVFQ